MNTTPQQKPPCPHQFWEVVNRGTNVARWIRKCQKCGTRLTYHALDYVPQINTGLLLIEVEPIAGNTYSSWATAIDIPNDAQPDCSEISDRLDAAIAENDRLRTIVDNSELGAVMQVPAPWAGHDVESFCLMLAGALSRVMLPDTQTMPEQEIRETIEHVLEVGPS